MDNPSVQQLAQYLQGPRAHDALVFAAGAVLSHPVMVADLTFQGIMKTPLKGTFIRYWPRFRDWVEAVEVEMDKNVAQEQSIENAQKAAPAAEPPKNP